MNKDERIKRVIVNHAHQEGHTVYPNDEKVVGEDGVTKISIGWICGFRTIKVWEGEHLGAEYNQHMIVGVEYMPPEEDAQ